MGLTKNNRYILIALILTFPSILFCEEQLLDNSSFEIEVNSFIATENEYTFFGLASYYNIVNYYIVNKNIIRKIELGSKIVLKENEWLAIVTRFQVMAVKQRGLTALIEKSKLSIYSSIPLTNKNTILKVLSKNKLSSIFPQLDKLRYYHLWTPIAWLAKLVEATLVWIQRYLVSNWGIVIIVFAVLLKLLLLPVAIMTTNFQRKVSQVQSSLAPKLSDIKSNYDGEEAHNRLMAAHKELGVSPFYTLKPMLGSFIQIPILIAVFNALGEMPQLDGQSFLWIENLAYPDAVLHFSFAIPMFGDTLSLLPFIMTVVTLYSTIIFQNRHAAEVELKRQKRNLYLMAAVFFVLFYPFPAVMVLYWALANILQTIQQKIIKI